jgi:hypothetical protein
VYDQTKSAFGSVKKQRPTEEPRLVAMVWRRESRGLRPLLKLFSALAGLAQNEYAWLVDLTPVRRDDLIVFDGK